jgi:2-methylisocitrate lyase-like PEP mutase family enzyme
MNDRQEAKAREFAALHVSDKPLVLYNAWDVGSARAVRDSGARAIATGSWSVAAAQGFEDGEVIPLDRVLDNIARIAAAVDVPVTLDFESGYARGGRDLEQNIRRVIEAGAIGINFEDQSVGDDAIYPVEEQSARIAAARRAADATGIPLFINARTDLFIRADVARHADHVGEAIARGKAYAAAGASGLFVPALRDGKLIERICFEVSLPVNVMFYPELPPLKRLGELGVARLSYGPRPFRQMMAALTAAAKAALTG